ncbi:MAG: hypothetical protein Q4E64_03890 [Phascolarctobacterium sp.]|uniref:hypothetical protein n=1 Tax=Phascolarctobacterium sp. TaxID=2049039 RepID=UPI0026DB3803|nr:hypothetical protein [Phascolarctobacterium sp.]MDO4920955.1 hypothetical protein [Phascolarctobacterium sp.]
MAVQSKISRIYELLAANPHATDTEIAEIMGDTTPAVVETNRYRLKDRGFIKINLDRSITVLKPFKNSERSFKQEVYQEMIEIYMQDFRNQATYNERIAVGREIRLILDKM